MSANESHKFWPQELMLFDGVAKLTHFKPWSWENDHVNLGIREADGPRTTTQNCEYFQTETLNCVITKKWTTKAAVQSHVVSFAALKVHYPEWWWYKRNNLFSLLSFHLVLLLLTDNPRTTAGMQQDSVWNVPLLLIGCWGDCSYIGGQVSSSMPHNTSTYPGPKGLNQ